jgi:hypothetical protein
MTDHNPNPAPRIIMPSRLDEETVRAKMLANKFCELAAGYENRELLAAAAVFASCTIKARYFRREWESAFMETVKMLKYCLEH